MKKYMWLVIVSISLIFGLIVSSVLYNTWFDTLDLIKQDRTYSPEFHKVPAWKTVVYYVNMVIWIAVGSYALFRFLRKTKT